MDIVAVDGQIVVDRILISDFVVTCSQYFVIVDNRYGNATIVVVIVVVVVVVANNWYCNATIATPAEPTVRMPTKVRWA